jgi:hypothetical protein
VLVAVRDDAAASPFDAVVKNLAHETKLKNWKHMSAEEKALSKLADVLEQVRLQIQLWLLQVSRIVQHWEWVWLSNPVQMWRSG